MAVAQGILGIRRLADLRSDEALVKAAQAGKRDAISALIERHYPRVLSFLSYLTGSRPQAEDLTQETFTKALGALSRFNGHYRFEPWLLRIAKNLVIDEARRNIHRAAPTDPQELPDLEPASATVDMVWESMDSGSARAIVTEALGRMPMRQRTILILREIEGLSYSEIAQIVGTNDRGVEATLRRARTRFRVEVAAAEGIEGQRAVCQRTLRLVATEGNTAEAFKHLARCEDCRTRSRRVADADKAFGLLPPLAAGKPEWLDGFTGGLDLTPAPRAARNILEVLRGSQAGAVSPIAHVAEMAAAVLMAGSLSVASIAGNVKKVTTTTSAAPPAAVHEGIETVSNPEVVTLDQALKQPEAAKPITSEASRPTDAPDDGSLLEIQVKSALLDVNLDASDLLGAVDDMVVAVDLDAALDLAVQQVADLGLDPTSDLESSSTDLPLELPTVPDVTSTIAPQVALPRRKPFLA